MSITLPFRHLSVRVPWHDGGWEGAVCKKPLNNNACLCLRGISENRDDSWEAANAGKDFADLGEKLPPCVRERSGFMSGTELTLSISHKLGHDEDYKHLMPTPLEMPPYSFPGLPFSWVSREGAAEREERLGIGYVEDREPMAGWKATGSWVLDEENQKACLKAFWSAIRPGRSLVFFYAKAIPGIEDNRRVLIGAARVSELKGLRKYIPGDPNGTGAWVWEMPVTHTLRPDFHDGFLMPYHELLKKSGADGGLDLSDYVAFAPEEHRAEFSYVTEHVTGDAALGALEEMRRCIERCKSVTTGPWGRVLSWINDRIIDVRKQRGACPGLGAALTAFGIKQGEILAAELTREIPDATDPWLRVEESFTDSKNLPPEMRAHITVSLRNKWAVIRPRKAYLRLLSRLALSSDQASVLWQKADRMEAGIVEDEDALLRNPYLICERWTQPYAKVTTSTDERGKEAETVKVIPPPTFWTVDRAVYLGQALAKHHPLPGPEPAWESDDSRRIRALLGHILRAAEREGHAALPLQLLVDRANALAIEPPVQVDEDFIAAMQLIWEAEQEAAVEENEAEDEPGEPELVFHSLADGSSLVQTLQREVVTREIRNLTRRVRRLPRLRVNADWAALLNEHLPKHDGSERERKAREEKASALAEICASRFSVLVGPAGTGKTSILRTLLGEPGIRSQGVLLLAPTGKARVRMQTEARHPAKTIAQFLLPLQRYNGHTGDYSINRDAEGVSRFKTVVVDEASMLTEDQLAALLDAVKAAERVILVGDPGQLPPIGVGRPFADLVAALKPEVDCWPCVSKGYAELTQRMRQDQKEGIQPLDLRLAEFFSGRVADDGILHQLELEPDDDRVRCVRWDDTGDFRAKLQKVLQEEFALPSGDLSALCGTLGGVASHGKWYFNRGAEKSLDDWQILAPMNLAPAGTEELNRFLHSAMRGSMVKYASGMQDLKFRTLKPLGAQQIVYGSKVINTVNRPHDRGYVWPHQAEDGSTPLLYLANGEIGMVTGRTYLAKDGSTPWFPKQIEVCFSSQPGFAYSFLAKGFGDEGDAPLQLAYAITVHKSQGSEFKKTFIVLPKSAATLSRELLYTALTRHKNKVILLHEGDIRELARWASGSASATAKRFTTVNLEEDKTRRPQPVKVKHPSTGREGWYESYLIHRTRSGILVASKAEVAVANELDYAREKRWLDFTYEERLVAADGSSRLPDFTIRDSLGRTFYWEHCGMPDDPGYAENWQKKLAWYSSQGIQEWHETDHPDGQLIVTRDSGGRLDSESVKKLVRQLFGPTTYRG